MTKHTAKRNRAPTQPGARAWMPLNPAGAKLTTTELCKPVDKALRRKAAKLGLRAEAVAIFEGVEGER